MLTPIDSYLACSGTTSARFARMVGVSKQTVDNWRYGRCYPRPSQLPAITRAMRERNQELRQANQHAESTIDGILLTLLTQMMTKTPANEPLLCHPMH